MLFRKVSFKDSAGEKVTVEIHREDLYLPTGEKPNPNQLMQVVGNDQRYMEEHRPELLKDFEAAVIRRKVFDLKIDLLVNRKEDEG